MVRDRLHPRNNPNGEDYRFLDAVGVIWAGDTRRAMAAATASTGFLIDGCHVLTSLHVVYHGNPVVNPPPGEPVGFAVGQTGDDEHGALQGLRYLRFGAVVARGESMIIDHGVHQPEDDWALVRLEDSVPGITPLSLEPVDDELTGKAISVAGFPADHRRLRGDALRFKDLWGSDGRVVAVDRTSTVGALIEATAQATSGDSGGPVYGEFNGGRHVVVGMVEAVRGNGIDISDTAPNREILFTRALLERIGTAQRATPCR